MGFAERPVGPSGGVAHEPGAAGMPVRMAGLGLLRAVGGAWGAEGVVERVDDALHVGHVDLPRRLTRECRRGVAGQHDAQLPRLVAIGARRLGSPLAWRWCAGVVPVDLADVEEPHVRLPPSRVLGHPRQEGRIQARSQDGVLLAERVEQSDQLGAARGVPGPFEVCRPDQRMAHHLVEAEPGQDAAHLVAWLARVDPIGRQRGPRQPPGDALVSVRAGHLLGDVGIRGHVEAMRRHADLEGIAIAVHLELERAKQLGHARARQLQAEQPGESIDADCDAATGLGLGVVVDDPARHAARR